VWPKSSTAEVTAATAAAAAVAACNDAANKHCSLSIKQTSTRACSVAKQLYMACQAAWLAQQAPCVHACLRLLLFVYKQCMTQYYIIVQITVYFHLVSAACFE